MPAPGFITRWNAQGYQVDITDTAEGRARADKRGYTLTEAPAPKAEPAAAPAAAAPVGKPKASK